MELTGELATPLNGPMQNVHRPGTEVEQIQRGAMRTGLSNESSQNRVSTSVVLNSLRSLSARTENTKRRRLVIEATGSIKSTYSSCESYSAEQQSTVPDSSVSFSKKSSSSLISSSVVDTGNNTSLNFTSNELSFLQHSQNLVQINPLISLL